MFELPLFPLNTVLFPGMPLPLHIFEERYKQMIKFCQDEQQPFGVVYIQRDVTVGGPLTTPRSIGCTARIIEVQSLAEGRMLVMTVGQNRFHIESLKHDQPYLVGKVELMPLEDQSPNLLSKAIDQLYPLVKKYLDTLSKIGEVEFNINQFPDDPEKFIYLAAAFIQLPQEQKQSLLETDQAIKLLNELYVVYHREVSMMQTMPIEDPGMFSIN